MLQCTKCGEYREVPPEIVQDSDFFFIGKFPGYEEVVKGIPFIGYKTIALRRIVESLNLKASYTNVVRCFIKNLKDFHIENCKFYLAADIVKANPKIVIFFGKDQARTLANDEEIETFPDFFKIRLKNNTYLATVFDNPASWIENPSAGSEQMIELISLMRIYKVFKAKGKFNPDDFPVQCKKNLLNMKLKVLSEFTKEEYSLYKPCKCQETFTDELIKEGLFETYYEHPWLHELFYHTSLVLCKNIHEFRQKGGFDLLSEVVALDFETNKLEIDSDFEVWGFSLATEHSVYFFPVSRKIKAREVLEKIISNPKVKKIVCHNLSFELSVLERYFHISSSFLLTYIDKFADSMSLYHMIFEKTKRGYGLKNILHSLGIPPYDISKEEKQEYSKKAAYYNMLDAFFTRQLYLLEMDILKNRKIICEALVNKLPFIIEMMEHYGMNVDKEAAKQSLEEESLKCSKILDKLHKFEEVKIVRHKKLEELNKKYKKKRVVELPVFNPLSVKDLRILFFEVMSSPVFKMKKSGPSIDASVLSKMKGSIPKLILAYREANKLITAFLKKLAKVNKVNSSYHQTGTTSGRLSSSNINLQQIPKEIRNVFVPRPGYSFVEIDVARAEAMMFGLLSGHEPTLKVLKEGDFHRWVASIVFGKPQDKITSKERNIAKTATFAVLYYTSAKGLAEGLAQKAGINLSEERCAKIIKTYNEKLPILSKFRIDCIKQLKKNYYIETPFGRRRNFFVLKYLTKYPIDREFIKQATNHLVQSSLSDFFQLFLIKLFEKIAPFEEEMRFVNSVHDSIVIEVKEGKVDTLMQLIAEAAKETGDFVDANFVKMRVPVKFEASIGKNWRDLVNYAIADTTGKLTKIQEKESVA